VIEYQGEYATDVGGANVDRDEFRYDAGEAAPLGETG